MEATLRAASELVTGKPADRLEFTEVRAVEGLRETYVAIGEHNIHVGVANGLTNAKILLDKVKAGKEQFHVIEVMACPGGCIGGGGQPYPPEGVKVLDPELLRQRAGALYAIDSGKKLRKSYENPAIEEVYEHVPRRARARKRPTNCCTPITSAETAARHPMSTALVDRQLGTSGSGRQAGPGRADRGADRAVPRASRTPESQLIAVLHKVQAQFGYLADAHLDAVAQLLQVPAAKVAGVASFYHFFRLKPRGKFMINVCLGTACYVKGADRVAQKVIDELGITWGETSKDGVFTLEGSRCLGTCGLAPVVMIDDEIHGDVTPDQVPALLEKYLKKAKEAG